MKLLRYGPRGAEKPGMLDKDGAIRDLSKVVDDIAGSVVRGEGTTIRFIITDRAKTVAVTFTGVLPDLFREGQGVVAEGTLEADGVFYADSVLAKHDENYMPPEVAKRLKAQGVWRGADEAKK